MKKMLLVLCVVMGFSLAASATHYTVTLNDYCDIWGLTLDKGYNAFTGLAIGSKIYVWGTHDLTTRCSLTSFDTSGQKHGGPATDPPNNLYGTSNALLDISDTEGNPEPLEFTFRVTNGCAVAVFTGGTGYGADIFFNYDFATCTIPAPEQGPGRPTLASRK